MAVNSNQGQNGVKRRSYKAKLLPQMGSGNEDPETERFAHLMAKFSFNFAHIF